MAHAYLPLIEDRRTHTRHPSYSAIAAEIGTTKSTAIKSIGILLDAGLITMTHSQYFDERGMNWTDSSLYTILPMRQAVNASHQQQFDQLELKAPRRRVYQRQRAVAAGS